MGKGVRVARVGEAEMRDIVRVSREFKLDFDDACPYVTARKYNRMLVSFDGDCDQTDYGRRTLKDVLAKQ